MTCVDLVILKTGPYKRLVLITDECDLSVMLVLILCMNLAILRAAFVTSFLSCQQHLSNANPPESFKGLKSLLCVSLDNQRCVERFVGPHTLTAHVVPQSVFTNTNYIQISTILKLIKIIIKLKTLR